MAWLMLWRGSTAKENTRTAALLKNEAALTEKAKLDRKEELGILEMEEEDWESEPALR